MKTTGPVFVGPVMLSALVLVGAVLITSPAAAVMKIACVGASTTAGDGSAAGHHFPDELGLALGADFQVKNFGAGGTTLMRNGDNPYWPHLPPALAFQPDIAVFWFGGNDAKAVNWTTHQNEFIGDYEDMVHMFQSLPTHPRTFIFKSMVTRDGNGSGIPKGVLEMQVLPKIDQIAAATGSIVVNYHDAFITHTEYFPDGVHPNNAGTMAIGKFVADIIRAALTMPPPNADAGADAAAPTGDAPGTAVADAAIEAATEAPTTDLGSATGTTGTGGGAGTSPAPGTAGTGGAAGGASKASNGGGCALAPSPSEAGSWLIPLAGAMFLAGGRRRRPARRQRA